MLNAEREQAIDSAEKELVEWLDGKRSWVNLLHDDATRVEVMMVDAAAQQALALSIIALKQTYA